MNILKRAVFLAFLVIWTGCGYTNKIVLPYEGAKTIAVPMFRNSIPPESMLTYIAGLEPGVTQAVIDELVRDGNLKVVDEKNADLILKGELARFEQEGFRFNLYEQVAQYRLFIVVRLELIDARTKKVYWKEKNFTGETDYFIQGPRAISQEQATEKAIADLAEKIANRVVEEW